MLGKGKDLLCLEVLKRLVLVVKKIPASFRRPRRTRLDELLGREKTFVSIKASPSVLSFNTSLILTFPLPAEMPSDIDPPTFVGFSVKSIISLLLL